MGCQNSNAIIDIPQNTSLIQQNPQQLTSIQNIVVGKKYSSNDVKTIKIIFNDKKENKSHEKQNDKHSKENKVGQTQRVETSQAKIVSKNSIKKTIKLEIAVTKVENDGEKKVVVNQAEGSRQKICSLKVVDQNHAKVFENIGPSAVSIGQIEEKPLEKNQITKKQETPVDFQMFKKPEAQQKQFSNVQLKTDQKRQSRTSQIFKFQVFTQSGDLISKTQKLIEIQIATQQREQIDLYLNRLLEVEAQELISRVIGQMQSKQQIFNKSNKNLR